MHHNTNPATYRILAAAAILLLVAGFGFTQLASADTSAPITVDSVDFDIFQEGTEDPDPVIDHSNFPVLEGPFETPQDVTRACLSCHSGVADEIMHTTHWTWEYEVEETGQTLGKKNIINNFCISIQSNEPRCTSCHIGYGWEDNTFDFTASENIDCLVCHDTTGTYEKFPTGAGYPTTTEREFPAGSGKIFEPPNLAEVAQSIGRTSRETCGACHFYGGGGDYVKHGDLDSSLLNPSYELDVHMSPEGGDFTCTTCHVTENHDIAGSRYSNTIEDWQGCEDCHTATPHELDSLNHHSERVACQTCHIPEFARGGLPTKMTWDWSTAGQLTSSGTPIVTKDENGNVIYDGKKGDFTWEYNVIPEYVWFNGIVEYTLSGEQIDPSGVVKTNQFLGDVNDETAKIWPVKNFKAVVPYDSGNDILAIPHLFGSDDAAFWKTFDWDASIAYGMDYAGLSYSGSYDFVETEMLWPTAHMVAPASEALSCTQCHTSEGGRLNFAALGYSPEDVTRLTNFPPSSNFNQEFKMSHTPETCSTCHETEYNLWIEGSHKDSDVGCVSCHVLEEEGEHPEVAFTMEKAAETCGTCHINEYRDWEESKHSEFNISCVSCHNPHSQSQMTVGDYTISCQTCHRDKNDDFQHSTHAAADLTCEQCHKNTAHNTGHSFIVQSDTCLSCHSEDIHTADKIVKGEGLDGQTSTDDEMDQEEEPEIEVPTPTAEGDDISIGISLPIWAGAFFGIAILGGLIMIFVVKPGNRTEPEDETSEESTEE